jgi:hypothetical protein
MERSLAGPILRILATERTARTRRSDKPLTADRFAITTSIRAQPRDVRSPPYQTDPVGFGARGDLIRGA